MAPDPAEPIFATDGVTHLDIPFNIIRILLFIDYKPGSM